MKFRRTLIPLGLAILISGCAPSESEQVATITQIAAGIIATQTAQAPTATPIPPTPTLSPGATRSSPVDGMTMIYIPGGEYTLGSTQADVDWAEDACREFLDDCDPSVYEDEMPQHTVQLDPYWIDQTEVTVAMFAQFVEAAGYHTEAERFQYAFVFYDDAWDRVRDADWQHPGGPEAEAKLDDPVVNVSWYDAWAYCEWAGRRLPTEAEWEAAARGTDLRIFPWGNAAPNDMLANLADKSIPKTSWRNFDVDDGYAWEAPVMSFPEGASPFGVLSMAGNVKEWVYDWFAPGGYDLPPSAENPVNTAETETRVHRGGSFATILTAARTARRAGSDPYLSSNDYGFRCAFSELILPAPPERDTPLPDVALVDWRTAVYSNVDGSFEREDYLRSLEGLEITGQYNHCMYLRFTSPDYPEGWLHLGDEIVLYKDCSELEEVFIRPATASWKIMGEGHGTLTVKNQESTDAFIVLYRIDAEREADEKEYMYEFWMYVRAGEQATMEDIPDGAYEFYVTNGTTWAPDEGRFSDAVSYEKLTELLEFTSTETQATWWDIVLKTVAGGNTDSMIIDESAFP